MLDLIVIRHGETDWNRQHRFQGQIDVPLNAMGLEQAARVAERLRHEPLDRLVSSDLERARTTAERIGAHRDRPALMLPSPDGGWREQGFGVLEGLDVPTIRGEHPDLWDRWVRHEADYALPGGESNVGFHQRVMHALRSLHARHAGERVLVVSHGGVLDMLWRTARGESLSGPRTCDIPNTGINRLRFDGERLEIVDWADAAHLAGLPPQPSTAQRSRPGEP